MKLWLTKVSVRWDPNRENEAFFHQTAMLHSAYYHLQISVHRSFIPKPSQPSSTSLPSLTICTNAARACIHVLEAQNRRRPNAVDGNMVRAGTCRWRCALH